MKRTARAGWGYYDVTHYPYGGCFHRLTEDTELEVLADCPKGEVKAKLPNGNTIVITKRALVPQEAE